MRNARYGTDHEYNFGIWPSTRKIRQLLADAKVSPEVGRLLDHIDGLVLEHIDAEEKLRRAATPPAERAKIQRDLVSHHIYG